MLSLPSIFDILSKVDNYPAEDFIDRLNFGASVYLLAFFVLITGSKQHFGNPIQCMAPPESPDSWVHYYHDYCYIQDKLRIFNMNVDKSLAFDIEAKQRAGADYTPIGRFTKEDTSKYWSPRVMYYQWVPYVLFLQALFFLVPKLFWKLVGAHLCHGVDLETAIVEAQKLRTLVGDDRAAALNNLANFIRDVLESKRRRSVFGSSMASICYSITKWLEVINGFGQLYMLTYFVGEGDYLWGIHLLYTVLNGTENPSVGIFPRIVLCDVTKFALANLHQVNMQCVLMLNFINEKIYTFLWFWIVFVTFASFLSAIRQMVALLFPVYRSLIADNFLPTQDVLFSNALAEHGVRPTPVTSRALVDYFIHKILRCDGVLLLSFINGNVGGLVTHDIAHQLWKITVQPSFKNSGASSSASNDCSTKRKESLYWPDYDAETVRKMSIVKRLEAAGDPENTTINNNKHLSSAQPMARTRALSVENLETEVPTAPMESSPLISEGSTQAVDDAPCPIQSLRASPGSSRRRFANIYPGVPLAESRHTK
uniref:Innexin n=1 Tax=Haemonchus contortus TaxID=6289 RepID=A0A7I4XZK4_HAECO